MRSARPAGISRSVIVGTAGHIDHGKTALVQALTGTDTDRLPEEKKRGITIDLGFAVLRLHNRKAEFQVSLIDVPGHHAFIKNMLAGAGGIEAVLLVIAADEGVMAQTREHVDICSLLGVQHGVVALTKCDAVDAERVKATLGNVNTWLESTFLRGAEVVPVSAVTGEGIERLRCELANLASELPLRSRDFVPRLPLDRSFAIRGFGTVVTGTLQHGSIAPGMTLSLLPVERRVRVRGIQVHGTPVDSVAAPSRVALNLSGIEHREIGRGQMLAPENTLCSTKVIDAELSLLPHAGPLRHRAVVRLHAFTGDVAATVLLYHPGCNSLERKPIVRLQLDNPQVLVPGDRFVLRLPSPPSTIGGGRVLDIAVPRRQRKSDALAWLERLRGADRWQEILLRISRRGTSGIEIGELVRETGLTCDAVRNLAGDLVCRNEVIAGREGAGPYLSGAAAAQAEAALMRAVTAASNHTMARAELRSRSGLKAGVFALALQRLLADHRLLGTDSISLPHASEVPEEELRRLAAVEQAYREAGVAPPLVADVAQQLKLTRQQIRATITLLLRGKRLQRLGSDDLFIHHDAVAQLADQLRAHRGEQFDVTRFKAFTGLTRKHAIPLLELLDRNHITRTRPGTAGIRMIV